mmetsp:Transcript_88368/g.283483  ORF Transcript_88368/g.283483 Transcript_88368/m.283483 type:complete len:272 (-) Transcript_88368:179-994(-)
MQRLRTMRCMRPPCSEVAAPRRREAKSVERASKRKTCNGERRPRSTTARRSAAPTSKLSMLASTARCRKAGRCSRAPNSRNPPGSTTCSKAMSSAWCSLSSSAVASHGSAKDRTEPSETSERKRCRACGHRGAASRFGTNKARLLLSPESAAAVMRLAGLVPATCNTSMAGRKGTTCSWTASSKAERRALPASRMACSCATIADSDNFSACSSAAKPGEGSAAAAAAASATTSRSSSSCHNYSISVRTTPGLADHARHGTPQGQVVSSTPS